MSADIGRKFQKASTQPFEGERSARPVVLTLQQVADQLQVSTKTVRRQLEKRGVPYVVVGAQIRVHVEHVHLLMNKRW